MLGIYVLLISGFDGAIYTWDINQYSENNLEFEKVRLKTNIQFHEYHTVRYRYMVRYISTRESTDQF